MTRPTAARGGREPGRRPDAAAATRLRPGRRHRPARPRDPRAGREAASMERLGDLLPDAARQFGLEDQLEQAGRRRPGCEVVAERVPAAAGSCRLIELSQGVATIEADEPIVAQEIRLALAGAPGRPASARPDTRPSAPGHDATRIIPTCERRSGRLGCGRIPTASSIPPLAAANGSPPPHEPRPRGRVTATTRLGRHGHRRRAEHRLDVAHQGQPLPARHGGRRAASCARRPRSSPSGSATTTTTTCRPASPSACERRSGPPTTCCSTRPIGRSSGPASRRRSASPWPSSGATSCTWPRSARPRPTWSGRPGC